MAIVQYPPQLQKLIRELSKLPSIGEKSATRLAYHLITNDRQLARSLAVTLREASDGISLCPSCFFMTDKDSCAICRDQNREGTTVCIVEKPMDLIAIERMGEFRGVYHVLHGLWAPMRGQGPDQMKLKELVDRVKLGVIKEAILALSSTVEGDATALFVARTLKEHGVRSTRLAQGMPKGGELEYADEITLSRAFSGRNLIDLS